MFVGELTFCSSKFKILGQSYQNIPTRNFPEQSISKTLDLLEGRSANVLGEIKNCDRWSEVKAVILLEIVSFEMTLLKMLSIRVLEFQFFVNIQVTASFI